MTEFKLDLSDMQSALSAQIITSLTDEAREKIITEAVNFLTAPQTQEVYGRKEVRPSVLQESFTMGVRALASRVASEMIAENPEVERRVREACGAAIIAWMEDDYNLAGVLADGMVEAFRNKIKRSDY